MILLLKLVIRIVALLDFTVFKSISLLRNSGITIRCYYMFGYEGAQANLSQTTGEKISGGHNVKMGIICLDQSVSYDFDRHARAARNARSLPSFVAPAQSKPTRSVTKMVSAPDQQATAQPTEKPTKQATKQSTETDQPTKKQLGKKDTKQATKQSSQPTEKSLAKVQ